MQLAPDGPTFDEGQVLAPATPAVSGGADNSVTVLHEVVLSVMREILNIDEIGIHTDFFELGVDSILGIQLITKLNQIFQIELPAVCLFEASTVELLSQYMIAHEVEPGQTLKAATLFAKAER